MTIQNSKTERFKFDALEYYKTDIDWFGFIMIFLCIDIFVAILIETGKLSSAKPDDQLYEGGIITETYLLYVIIGSRLL